MKKILGILLIIIGTVLIMFAVFIMLIDISLKAQYPGTRFQGSYTEIYIAGIVGVILLILGIVLIILIKKAK
ncbi:MAG: hypothetical protein ACFFAN_18130 [Promethearchaeota archaeon]